MIGKIMILILAFSILPSNSMIAQTLTPITHVIVIMQENHSFDNYFGTYPTGNGTLNDPLAYMLQRVNGIPDNICLPYGDHCIKPYYANYSNTVGPYEGQLTYEDDVNNGLMDGFAKYSGPQSMAYFDYHQLAAYWDYAEEYAIGDYYFATYLSTTTPNRLSIISGDSVVSANYGPPPFVDFQDTIFSQLTSAGISWGYFEYMPAFGTALNVYPLNYLSGMEQSQLKNIQNISDLLNDLKMGQNLPSVSFVSSIGTKHYDEHPPFNVTEGELWVVSIINAVMESSYWNTSAIFVTWDEGGGYYDHVPPPQTLSTDHNFNYPLMSYGQRVPLLVISPFAKENYVSETLLSHLSIIHFIEYNWGLQPLNSFVAQSNIPLDLFFFGMQPRPPLILSQSGEFSFTKYPIPLQIPFDKLPYDRTGSLTTNPETYMFPNFALGISAFIVAAVIVYVTLKYTSRKRRAIKVSRLQILCSLYNSQKTRNLTRLYTIWKKPHSCIDCKTYT